MSVPEHGSGHLLLKAQTCDSHIGSELDHARVQQGGTTISRSAAGLLALTLAAVAGCGYSWPTIAHPADHPSSVAQPATRGAANSNASPTTSDCTASLHAIEGQTVIPELQGQAKGGQVTALVFHPLPLKAMQESKIVWRVTGHGQLHLTGSNETGDAPRISGPERHLGGDWGTFIIFPSPGCWRIHVQQDDLSGDVFLPVLS